MVVLRDLAFHELCHMRSVCVTLALLLWTCPLRAQAADTSRNFPASYPRSLSVEPGDVLHVRIWREPDLSGDFPVADDGMVVLPKLGPIKAAAVSPDSLRNQLIVAYGQYLRNPAIDIAISRRISVLGEVKTPGSYKVDPTQTVADLLAAAGGFASDADLASVHTARQGTTIAKGFRPDATVAELQLNSGDELVVDKRTTSLLRSIYGWASAGLVLAYLAIRIGLINKL